MNWRATETKRLTVIGAAALVAGTLSLGVAEADASTVSLDASNNVVYTAAAGEPNRLQLEPEEVPSAVPGPCWGVWPYDYYSLCLEWQVRAVRVIDSGAKIAAGSSTCVTATENEAVCTAPDGGAIRSARVALSDRDDTYVDATQRYIAGSEVRGGTGNDNLRANNGTLVGEAGDDVLEGPSVDGGPGADRMKGFVHYDSRTNAVKVTQDGLANDGETGEADNVTGGVAGGLGNDTLAGPEVHGNAGDDTLDAPTAFGDAGNDVLSGHFLSGGAGDDSLRGDLGGRLSGGIGNDTLKAGQNSQFTAVITDLRGDEGNDVLDGRGTGGFEEMYGGPGNDALRSDDGAPDSDSCGDGPDTVFADSKDEVSSDCEVREAPDTAISSGPSGPTNDPTPTFGFSSPASGSSFECRVDAGAYTACSSPHTTAALSDGAHTFAVRAKDGWGNVDPTPATRNFTVDATPPSVKAPLEALVKDSALATASVPTSVPVTQGWSGTDSVSSAGELRYDVQRSVNSSGTWGAFGNVLGATSLTSLNEPLTQNYGYQYRARARDAAGNYSAYATGARFRVRVAQESPAKGSPSLSYSSGWKALSQSDASGGRVYSASTAGASATFTFTGRAVAAVMPKASTLGEATVCLDPGTAAQSCETIDLSPSSGLGPRKLVFARNGLSSATHMLRVTVASGRVDLDGFALLMAAS